MWQRMSDEPQAACPHCGGSGVRLFFPAGIVFKGSGFYKTDSRGSSSSASSTSSSSTSSPATSSPSKSDAGGDSTAAAKPTASTPATNKD